MSLPYNFLNLLRANTFATPARRQPEIRDVPLYVAPPPPPPVPMASEVRPAAPIAPTFQPMVVERTMPQLPMLTSVPQRAVAPATDYSRPEFQLPNIPERPTLPQMPTRDFGQEQRVTSRNTLRATLLGALLGGGAGALGAMTGAQQGARQAFDQDYAQRMAQFQNEQQMALQQKQLADQEYNQRIAAVNALMGRADAQRAANQQFLDIDYSNQVAQYNAQREVAEQARKDAENRALTLRSVLPSVIGLRPQDQQAALGIALTGQIPEGFTGVEKAPAALTEAQIISNLRQSGNNLMKTMVTDPKAYETEANRFNAAVMDNPNIDDAMKRSLLLPERAFKNQFLLNLAQRERKFNENVRQFGIETAMKKQAAADRESNLAFERGLKSDRLALDRIKAFIQKPSKAAAGGANAPGVKKVTAGEVSLYVKIFNSRAKEITELIESLGTAKNRDNPENKAFINSRIQGIRSLLEQYAKDPDMSKYVSFAIDSKSNIYSATPNLRTVTQESSGPSKYTWKPVE